MKHYWRALMSMTFVLGIVVMGFSPAAQALPMLELSDGVITKTITDGGVGDNSVDAGVVSFDGAVSSFSVNVTTGITKPMIGTAAEPRLDLLSVNISDGDGTITLKFTDTDFTVPGPPGYVASIGGTTDGTVDSYTVYRDQTNTAFGTSETLATLGPFSPTAFDGNIVTGGIPPATGPYSLTLEVKLTHTGVSQITSFNAEIAPQTMPEPGTMLLFGTGLFGTLGYGWRRRQQAA